MLERLFTFLWLSMLCAVAIGCSREADVTNPQTKAPQTRQVATAPSRGHSLSPKQIEGEWRSVAIAYRRTYSEHKWDRLDLVIEELSPEELRVRVVPGRYGVSLYEYLPGQPLRYLIEEMQPGWFEPQGDPELTLRLGAIGSHYALQVRLDDNALLHLEGGPFERATFKRPGRERGAETAPPRCGCAALTRRPPPC